MPWRELALVCLLFALLTLALAAPLSLQPATRALPLSADTRLFLWTLSWDVHALVERPLALFDANIFFPERRTLAYSEHLLGSALLSAPALLATGNPLLALNVVVLLSCVLSGLGTYLLARRLGASAPAAILAGIAFAFGAPRFVRLAQVHVATVQWIPFTLACLHAYRSFGRKRDLRLAALLFTVQALTSGHAGLFLAIAVGTLAAYLWALGELPPLGRTLRDLGLPGGLLLAVNAVFLIPYLQAQRAVGLHRTLGSVYDWAPNAVSFLASPGRLHQSLLALFPSLAAAVTEAKAYLFPGWIVLALTLAALAVKPRTSADTAPASAPPPAPFRLKLLDGLIALAALLALVIRVSDGIDWRLGPVAITARTPQRALVALAVLVAVRLALDRSRPLAFAGAWVRCRNTARATIGRRLGVDLGFYLALALVSLWACLGPGYVLYTALYRLVPGFDLIRVPSRLGILTLLALAVLAARGMDALLAGLPARLRPAATGTLLLLSTAECVIGPTPGEAKRALPLDAPVYAIDVPAVDRELAKQARPFAAVELPVADPDDATHSARLHSHYMLHSMSHWQPIVNGYSGIVPPRHQRLFRLLTAFPDSASLYELETLGVTYAVLHRGFYGETEWTRAIERASSFDGRLRLVAETPDGRLYSITRARRR